MSKVHLVTFCGSCGCGCPELYVDHDAPASQRIVLTDDFGQRVQMSVDQFGDLLARATSGELTALMESELARA